MMKKNAYWISGLTAALVIGMATANARPIKVDYRLGLRYDDNVTQRASGDDKKNSLVVFNRLSLDLESVSDAGYFGLRYGTTYTWYDDRPTSASDWNHSLNVKFSRTFNPRLVLALNDTFTYVESPELQREDGALFRDDSSYSYNTLNGSLTTVLKPSLSLDWSGRHSFLRYEDNGLADREDYDLIAAGLVLRSTLTKDSSIFAEVRYETQDYLGAGEPGGAIDYPGSTDAALTQDIPDRGTKTISYGVGVNQMFSPNLIGSARGGYMTKDFDAANAGSESAPYGEASLTVVPAPATRITFSANYSLYQSSLITFANQTRTSFAINLSQDLGPKLTAYLGASYIESEYESKTSVDTLNQGGVLDGTEESYDVSARLAYRLNRMNYFELGFTTTDLSSDLRDEFTRNRYDMSWNLRL